MSDNIIRLNVRIAGELPPFACVRGSFELGVGPWPDSMSAQALVVARVERPVSVDEWEALFALHLNDGGEYPAYRAAVDAVRRWGGRVTVGDPRFAPRPILTPEQEAYHREALEVAAARLSREGSTPAAVAAWQAAARAFDEAQLAAIAAWPFTYASGETPQVGDIIVPVGNTEERHVVALAPPELRVGTPGPVAELARAAGAEVHASGCRVVPQLCRLVRRTRPVPEA